MLDCIRKYLIKKTPLFFKQNANDIKKANRILSRKKKGSNHRRLAKIALARLYKKISNQRTPLFFKQNANDIKKANRILSRKKKGSNHRRLAKIALARLYKKISNQRKDFHFKLANKICSE